MDLLRCPACEHPAWYESSSCEQCGTEMMMALATQQMVPAHGQPTVRGRRLDPCANRNRSCNWSVDADGNYSRCFSCRLTRTGPDPSDSLALDKLEATAAAKRRLLIGLVSLGLPVRPFWAGDGGLGFDLLSSRSGTGPVVIGHAGGIVTIDLAETLDDYREQLRVSLGEPYRTMLGHFRHEVGHYYQWQLVERVGGDLLDRCRDLFGDERASYSDALARHYARGAPPDWQVAFISEYATMHPWEDFAETFAHYQHIVTTLTTVANGGLTITLPAAGGAALRVVQPRADYRDVPFDDALADWRWVSYELNRANRAMGKGDLYPFRLPEPVATKLGFVHDVVLASQVEHPIDLDL